MSVYCGPLQPTTMTPESLRMHRIAPWTLAACLVAAAVAGQSDPSRPSQEGLPPQGGEAQGLPAVETAITVALPEDRAAEAQILAGGEALPFRVLEPGPWEVVIFFDQLLSSPGALRNGAVLLSERADLLADMGPVRILLGGATVRSALPPTREGGVIADTLSWLRIRESSADAQGAIRREFAAELGSGELTDEGLEALLAESLAREAELMRLQRESVLLWASAERSTDRRLLLLVGSGFDSDPTVFYREQLRQADRAAVLVPSIEVTPSGPELAQSLAVRGWTVVAFAPEDRTDALLAGPDDEPELSTVQTPDGRDVERGVISFDPRKLLQRDGEDSSAPSELEVRLSPLTAFEPLSRATGGAVVSDPAVLDNVLEELQWRAVLAVEAPVTGEPLPLTVTASGVEPAVAAPAWLARGAPAALSVARARYLAGSGETADGDLQLAALVTGGEQPRLALELSSAGGGEALKPPLRLTVARASDAGVEILEQRELAAGDIARGRFDLPLAEAPDPASPYVVVVDELSTDRWGGVFAGLSSQAAPSRLSDGSTLLDLPAAAKVRLLAPQDPLLVGLVRFAAVVADPSVRRVDFLLDGEQEAVRRAPPFEAELDLGALPRSRRVEAVARDAAGEELGRDVLLVNSGNSELSVRLDAPGAERFPGGSVKADRELTVLADVAVPRAARVARVEFFWRDQPVGVLYAPPYRQRILLPSPGARGFVRVVVALADGAMVEDVLFVNSAGSSARLQVTLVEVLAVVTDAAGRPVANLEREAFSVEEGGEPQELATFSSAESMPLTVGLAVDSSASMFIKLPRVQLAAMDFLRNLLAERDRAFVVGFGTEPQLLTPTTSDVTRLVAGVDAMRPDGFTSIWKGIVYSLVQLQGTPGKKALIVYTDGADEDPDFSYRVARRFARVVGVPIYVILSNNEIVRTEGKGLNIRGFLGRLEDLVDDVGGRVYFTRVGEDLEGVYAEIAEELRSQYVLGYYGEQDESAGWRKIEVDVSIPGLKVRSARGRYP